MSSHVRFATLVGLLAATLLPANHLSAQTPPQLLPYTVSLIAGGGTTTTAKGAKCPISGNTSTDAYGDGCLATEIQIGNTASAGTTPGSRSAVADVNGNVFFTDYNAGLVRRVDVSTGVVTAVAGGATTNPGTGTACGAAVSLDAVGDGCPATSVKLSHPGGIAFAPNGDLYFGDTGLAEVRKVAATGGLITGTGTISLVAGNVSTTFGYGASNATTVVTSGSASSYLRAPYGIAFDTKGDLFIVDEYTEAILVVNTNAVGSNTVNGVPVAAGQIWKIAGTYTGTATPSPAPYCVNGTATGYGCSFGLYTENTPANSTVFDSTYAVAVGPDGTVYAADEFYDSIFKVTPAGVISTFAGKQNSVGVKPTIGNRGTAGSFGIGSPFGAAADNLGNVYFTDASSGVIWRVDGANSVQYVVAGGAAATTAGAPCPSGSGTATDTFGDGCPATQAKLGSSGSGNYATTGLPGPGVFGVSVDANYNLYFGDTETNLVREVSSGTQFGNVGVNRPTTNTLDIHYVANDGPAASNPFVVVSGSSSATFTLGTVKCTTNTPDGTTDCLLPLTATATATGPFTGTLTVQSNSANGGTSTFNLSGTGVSSPYTRTSITATSNATTCAGATTFATSTTFTFTATIASTGSPLGTVTFYANGTQIGIPVSVMNGQAQITTSFPTAGTYNVTATYNGDTYFQTSTTATPATVTTATPSFTSAVATSDTSVKQGGTALYSFTLTQSVYSGTITFSCSNLPANATCVFSPANITATGCSTTNTVALNIYTKQGSPAGAGILPFGGGRWSVLFMAGFLLLIAGFGVRQREAGSRLGQLALVLGLLLASSGLIACGNGAKTIGGTPLGSQTVTVTATGSTGGVISSTPITLTVN